MNQALEVNDFSSYIDLQDKVKIIKKTFEETSLYRDSTEFIFKYYCDISLQDDQPSVSDITSRPADFNNLEAELDKNYKNRDEESKKITEVEDLHNENGNQNELVLKITEKFFPNFLALIKQQI